VIKLNIEDKVSVGFYIDRSQYKKIKKWCAEKGIDFYVFCRVATQHLFFYLTILPGDGPRAIQNQLIEFTENEKLKGGNVNGRHQRKNRRV
jgi:hypothetical protein